MKKKIFVITGETSGDILAAEIIKYIDLENTIVQGISGYNLKKLGVKGPFENKDITFFGITDVIRNFLYIKKKINECVKYIENFKPDIIFSVDSPDFVFQVIKKIKKKNIVQPKFFHFVAPSIWAWRERRAQNIKKLLDKVYLLFKFEEKYFNKYNILNQFVGHPFFENFIFTNLNLNVDKKIISFCPGSRKSEIELFLPIFIDTINHFGNKFSYHFGLARGTEKIVQDKLKTLDDIEIIINTNEDLKNVYYKKSLITIAKSGTISLDLCKSQIPFLTIYKLSWLNYLIIKPFIKVKFINIINIIAKKEIIPELIQNDCTSKKIIQKINFYLSNKLELKKMVEEYNSILKSFSNKKTSKKIAEDLLKNLE